MSWWQTEEDKVNGTITVTDEYRGNPNAVLNGPEWGRSDIRRDQDGGRWDRNEDGSWRPSIWP